MMRPFIKVGIALLATIALVSCGAATSVKDAMMPPGEETPPPVEEDDQGTAQYQNGTLTVPGAEIVVNGELFEGVASIPSTTSTIVGIVKGDDVYLWHPRLGSVDLSQETSERALALVVVDPTFTLQPASSTAGQKSTGLTVTSADPLAFKNDTKRWHAVAFGSDANVLKPGTTYDTGIRGGKVAAGLYGSIFWGVAIPNSNYIAVLTTYMSAIANGASSDVFAQLALVEFGELAAEIVSLALGIKFPDCAQQLFTGSLLSVFRQAFAVLASDSREGVLNIVQAPLRGSVSGFLKCVSDGIAAQGKSSLVAKTLFKVASLAVDLYFKADFVKDKVMASHDVYHYEAYEIFEPEDDDDTGEERTTDLCVEGTPYSPPYWNYSWATATAEDVEICTQYGLVATGHVWYSALKQSNDDDVIDLLLAGGANANENVGESEYGRTDVDARPLHIVALRSVNPEIIRVLTRWGGDINAALSYTGPLETGIPPVTPLDIAMLRRSSDPIVAEALITTILAEGGTCLSYCFLL